MKASGAAEKAGPLTDVVRRSAAPPLQGNQRAAPWPLEPARKDIMTRKFATILVVVLATIALQAGPYAASRAPSTDANSSFEEPVAKGTESGETVGFWNLIGINTILATPLGPRAAPLGSRAMAMMHVAMADAVASIHPTLQAIRSASHRSPRLGQGRSGCFSGVRRPRAPVPDQPTATRRCVRRVARAGSGREGKRQRHCPGGRSGGADCGAPRE